MQRFGWAWYNINDATSIFLNLKNTSEKNLVLPIVDLVGFCSDGANVMILRDTGLAAGFKKLDGCFNMFSVHVEYHT